MKKFKWALCGAGASVLGWLLFLGILHANREQSSAPSLADQVASLKVYPWGKGPSYVAPHQWQKQEDLPESLQKATAPLFKALAAKPKASPAPAMPVDKGPFADLKQARAHEQFRKNHGASALTYLRPEETTVRMIKDFQFPARDGEAPLDTARRFLTEASDLLRIRNGMEEWRLATLDQDKAGRISVRMNQYYQGLAVWPSQVSVHLNENGDATLFDGVYVPTPDLASLNPTVPEATAVREAARALDVGVMGRPSNMELIVHGVPGAPTRLAWKFTLTAGFAHSWTCVVDAQTAAVAETIPNFCTLTHVNGSGTDLLGNTVPLNVSQENGTNYLRDISKPMYDPATTNGVILIKSLKHILVEKLKDLESASLISSDNPNSWDSPDGVSALYNLSKIYDYFFSRHSRNSIDGNGISILAYVEIQNFSNASMNTSETPPFMVFGDTDDYAASEDVTAHEFTHGIAGLIGNTGVLEYQSQSGALNESFADVFGEMAEKSFFGTNDWLIGSRLTPRLRSMSSPRLFSQPDHMSLFLDLPPTEEYDNGGVHINSGIINRAYYLLAEGSRNPIGVEDAQDIWYQALTLHMKPRTQFVDARLGCIAAAETLFGTGSYQALKTAEAFDAVGIFAAPAEPETPSQDRPVNSSPDSLLFTKLQSSIWTIGRRESALFDGASGSILVNNVKQARPTVTADGTEALFMDNANRLYLLDTSLGTIELIGSEGVFHSVAISPDSSFAAFVVHNGVAPTNQIALLNLQNANVSIIQLKTPVFDADPIDNIDYADTLSFSPDGKSLLFDVQSTSWDARGASRSVWSIHGLDTDTGTQYVILPSTQGFQFGNPTFGNVKSRYFAFEIRGATANSAIASVDLIDGSIGLVGTTTGVVGFPSFSPDDSALLYSDSDFVGNNAPFQSLYLQPLAADHVSTNGARSLHIKGPSFGQMYRRGTYRPPNLPPSLSWVSPFDGSTHNAPASITLAVNASDSDGSVVRVDFLEGSQILGTDDTPPYELPFQNVGAGNYTVYARAYDDYAASTTIGPLKFRVLPPSGTATLTKGAQNRFEGSLEVPQPGVYRIEASTNLVDWHHLGTHQSQNGTINFQNLNPNLPVQLYFRALKID